MFCAIGPIFFFFLLILMVAWFKVWVCGCLLAGIVGLNPAGGMDVCPL